MAQLSPSLRKAAVLIAALDERSADALLQQMGPEEAAKVRSALMVLDDIPAAEQQQVLADFLGRQPAAAQGDPDSDVSLELTSAVESAAEGQARPAADRQALRPMSEERPSFAFLEQVDSKPLARLLCREHAQTVAVVVAHLSPARAATLLEQLPSDLATDALERTAWLEEVSPEIKSDLARALRDQLAPHIQEAAPCSNSLAHLSAVLGAMDDRRRLRLAEQLSSRSFALRRHLQPEASGQPAAVGDNTPSPRYRLESELPRSRFPAPATEPIPDAEPGWLDFGDLMLLEDAALRAIFAEVDPEVAILALTGAEPQLVARIGRKLPAAQAVALRQRLEHPGPIRLREIEQARVALAAAASRLAHEGKISLPESIRFNSAI